MNLRSNKRINIAFACLVILACLVGTTNAEASAKNNDPATISLTAEEVPLGEVLKIIADKSGYDIAINSPYAQLPIATSFQDLSLYEALRRVLGRLNRYILINESDRTIRFGFVDESEAALLEKSAENPSHDDSLVPPWATGDKSITSKDIKESRYNPDESELFPPDKPGEKGNTSKDIEALKAQGGKKTAGLTL